MKTLSLQRIAQLIGFAIVIAGLPFDPHIAKAQFPPAPFPVLEVDSAVRARLAEEWEPTNRYQHERGYCVRYTTEYHAASWFHPPIVIYTLVEIIRGDESHTTQSGIGGIGCPAGNNDITFLHVHPPFFCTVPEKGETCSSSDPLAHQCFPSDTDVATLLRSRRPFDLVQCDQWAIVPYWRPAS